MNKRMLALIIAIPLASVVMGAVIFYLAISVNDGFVEPQTTPLSKTSWNDPQ